MPIHTTLSYTTDLDRGVVLQQIRPALLTLDQEAHRFQVACTHGDVPVSLTGSVMAYFIRSDGFTVPIPGSIEANRAVVTLPAACYTQSGRFSLVIKVIRDSVTSTVFWGEGSVTASRSEMILDQEGLLPDLTELLAQIDAMEAATRKAEQAALDASAAAAGALGNLNTGPVAIPVRWDELTPLAQADLLIVLEAARPVPAASLQALLDSIPDGGSADLTVDDVSYPLRRLGQIHDTLMFRGGELQLCRKVSADGASLRTEYLFEPVPCQDLSALFDHFELPCAVSTLLSGKASQVSYAACGAPLDGIHDDYEAMYRAHFIADHCSCDVIQHTGTIYKACSGWLHIRNHNVDLSGCRLKIDANNRYGCYWLSASSSWAVESDVLTALRPQMTEHSTHWPAVETGFPANGLFIVTRPAAATRYDDGVITTEDRTEIVRHASDGHVYSTVIDDAQNDTAVTFCRYPETQLTFRGCTLELDVAYASVAVYFMRCERSNVIIRDFLISPSRRTTMNTGYRGAVFTLNKCADVTMENIRGINIAGKPTEAAPRGTAGYILHASSVLDLTVRDCSLLGYWGCVGLNGAKEVTFDGCEVNRVDIHDYFRNLTIINCRLYGQAVSIGYGKGAVNISNCSLLTDQVHQIVNLRCDYGRYFEGEINLCNVDATYTGTGTFDVISGTTLFSAASAAATGLFMKHYPAVHVCNLILRLMKDSAAGYVLNMPAELESAIPVTDRRKVIEHVNLTAFNENGDLLSLLICPLEGVVKCSASELAALRQELAQLRDHLSAMENTSALSS